MDEKKVKEAIEFLQRQICTLDAQKEYDEYCNPVHSETLELAIELCEIAIEALEKQLPKKLVEYHYEEPGEEPYIKYGCGNGCRMQPTRSSKYCNQCGQRIDWSEE